METGPANEDSISDSTREMFPAEFCSDSLPTYSLYPVHRNCSQKYTLCSRNCSQKYAGIVHIKISIGVLKRDIIHLVSGGTLFH